MVTEGTVNILTTDQDNKRILVAHKCAREFVGEMDLITSRRTLADGVTHTACLLLRIPRERVRTLLDAEGEIASLIVEAALLRRAAMMRSRVTGLVLIGLESSSDRCG